MSMTTEPIRAGGLSPEEREKLDQWLKSPEGSQEIADTCRSIERIIAEIRKERGIPLHLLHTPMDL